MSTELINIPKNLYMYASLKSTSDTFDTTRNTRANLIISKNKYGSLILVNRLEMFLIVVYENNNYTKVYISVQLAHTKKHFFTLAKPSFTP